MKYAIPNRLKISRRAFRRPAKISLLIVSALVLTVMQSPLVYAQLSADQITAFNEDIRYFNTEVCGSSDTNNQETKTIVLDPGHSGEDKTVVDKETGLHDHDYPSSTPEMQEVFDIAMNVKSELEDAGYTVLMTKGGLNPTDDDVNDYVSLRDRAEVANNAKAALAVSIHDDHGEQWSNFAQIYEQRVDGYRTGTKGKVTFKDVAGDAADDIAKASQDAAKIFKDERTKAEGRNVDIVAPNFNGRDGIDPGNMAQVEMFSKVPWVYNEVGAAPLQQPLSKDRQDKYTQGLVNAIKKAVPITNASNSDIGAAANDTSNTTASGTIAMQKVDLTQFKPDPKASSYFDKTSLPLMKKYMPLYVKAAELEGVSQNWEILASLHGPELGYGNYFEPNGLVGGASGPSGPYQETASELAQYLNNAEYGPVLKTLVNADGSAKTVKKLSDDQFIVLSRLAFKRWVSQALGDDYAKLKSGPIAFNPAVNSSNIQWKIMARWNGGAVHTEGFNGYNTTDHPYSQNPSVWPGSATTYYLLKQWEANGGMVTTAGSTGSCSSGTASTGSVDCQSATGNAKILCEARKYDPNSYVYGGAHGDGTPSKYLKRCPNPTTDTSCGIDCSSLVSIAVYKAFGYDHMWITGTQVADTKNWKEIPLSDLKAGDTIQPNPDHVEIVDTVQGSAIKTFGAHTSHYPQPKQVGPSSYVKNSEMKGYRYIGPGSGN